MKKMVQKMITLGLAVCLIMSPTYVMAREITNLELSKYTPIRVTVESESYIEKEGKLSDITIEERSAGCLTNTRDIDERTLVLSLKNTPYSFTDLPKITLSDGFKNLGKVQISYGEINKKEDTQIIYITLPYSSNKGVKGTLTVSDLKVTASTLKTGDLNLNLGLLSETRYESVKVAEVLSYGATLKVDRVKAVVTGDNRAVSFELQEGMPDSFIANRPLEFTIDKGYFRSKLNNSNILEVGAVLLNGKDITNQVKLEPEIEEGLIVGFTMQIPTIDTTIRNTLSFKGLQLCAKSSDSGDITLTVEGRGITNPISEVIAEIETANSIRVEGIKAKVGVRNQVGGKIIISENDRGMLAKGKIRLEMEGEPYIYYNKTPRIKVIQGDVELKVIGWADEKKNILEIEVTRTSREASIIEISDFTYSVDRTAPDGKFALTISGSALSPENPAETTVFKDFMITSMDDIELEDFPVANQTTTTVFKLGSARYMVNGKVYEMDAVPFSQDGRTMIPIRYAAEAAGISSNDVKFSGGVIIVPASKKIEMTLGSKIVKADGEVSTMITEPISLNGRTYVPISEIAKLLNLHVQWNQEEKTATFVLKK